MNLRQYLNEKIIPLSKGINLNDYISQNCKPYLKLIKNKEPLKRGMSTYHTVIGIKTVRQDREPSGMYKELAKKFNIWLEKHNHLKRDNVIFASSSPDVSLSS